MIFWGMVLVALLIPLAVWGATLRMNAKGAGASGANRPNFWGRALGRGIRTESPIFEETAEDTAEEERAQARLANSLYEDDFNYHRAA
jgi:hypothetical protein